jgi:hypothetical protein
VSLLDKLVLCLLVLVAAFLFGRFGKCQDDTHHCEMEACDWAKGLTARALEPI